MRTFVRYFPIAYVCIHTINRVSHGLCHNITSGRCRTFWSVDVPQLLVQSTAKRKWNITYSIEVDTYVCDYGVFVHWLTFSLTTTEHWISTAFYHIMYVYALTERQPTCWMSPVTPAVVSVWIQSIRCATNASDKESRPFHPSVIQWISITCSYVVWIL